MVREGERRRNRKGAQYLVGEERGIVREWERKEGIGRGLQDGTDKERAEREEERKG